MASRIGIKIANGDFYPIVEEDSLIKKRLILTTVHDNQPSVQIDLYRSSTDLMADAQYIGTVVVENIKKRPKGEPSIEMIISSDSNGNIVADAIDLDNTAGGEHYVLTVSLKSMDETSRDLDIPDFELESSEEPPSGLYQHASRIRNEKKSAPKPWIFVLIGIILILALIAAWLFFFGGLNLVKSFFNKPAAVKTEQPAASAVSQPVLPLPEPAVQIETVIQPQPQSEPVLQIVEPPPVIAAPVDPPAAAPVSTQVSRRSPPVASYNVPAVIPREGINYTIRWGDTLWDISEAFYRTPWLYMRIAQFNNIRNPNYIISGRTIRVPPRN